MATRRVHVVPHTHWDREWYLPFQRFRARLVELIDELLGRMEADPTYLHFLLDGQMAALDDYLAVRPQHRERIIALARNGRVAMGPWYTLPDEFLVSGETLVRNLQTGCERADEYAGPMEVGYLPDMFGHVAQMPQLLRQFGFEHAVVWRGVPAAIERTGFWWSAPDGSRVRTEYLPTGYGNGAVMPRPAGEVIGRLEGWEHEVGTMLTDEDAVLWMNGSDHRTPQGFLPQVVAEVNATGRYDMRITSLAEHLDDAVTDGLPEWHGEMRSSARANLLMGVISNRVDVKIAAARAERALEQQAEPLAALFLPADAWPAELVDEAWLSLLRNAAHDSICACSDDEVVEAVVHRYAEARQIAEAVEEQALRHFGEQLSTTDTVVVNPSPRQRSGLVTVNVPGHEPIPGSQTVRVFGAETVVFDGACAVARAVVPEVAAWTDDLSGITVSTHEHTVHVVLHADDSAGSLPPSRGAIAELLALEADTTHVHAVLRRGSAHRALVHMAAVPGYGWAPIPTDSTAPQAVRAEGDTVANGILAVTVSHRDGTFAIDGVDGFGRIVNGGDVGDTYNWCPPEHDTVVEGPESVKVEVLEAGPLRGVVQIDAQYRWPARGEAAIGRRVGEEAIAVVTTLELHAGERFLRVTHTIDNRSEDHRTRVLLPLPESATASRAECAFTVVERGLTAESGPTELGVPTFPSRRFVQAGGLTVAHEGLLEYELVDIRAGRAHALALTLLRATRFLSRGQMATRPLAAGPVMELAGSQVPGRHTLRYALCVDPNADPYALVDDAFLPMQPVAGGGHGHAPSRGQRLRVEGGAVVSSLRRRGGRLELRAFNPSSDASSLRVDRAGRRVDLRGRDLGAFDRELQLQPYEIVTLSLDN